MTIQRLVLNMRRRYRNPPFLLLRRLVNLIKGNIIRQTLQPHMLRDRRRQRRLPMIDVTNRSNIHMRLLPLKLFLRHLTILPLLAGFRPQVIYRRSGFFGHEIYNRLPSEMSESLVGLGHFMGVFLFLDGGAFIPECIHEFSSHLLRHSFFISASGIGDNPSNPQRRPP